MAPDPPHIHFVTTVGDVVIPYDPDRTVGEALREGLRVKFGPDFEVRGYHAVTTGGERVDPSATIGETDISDGDRLHIDPDPGLAPMQFEVVTPVGDFFVSADPDEHVVDLLRRAVDEINRDDMTGYQLVDADGDPLLNSDRIADTDIADGDTLVLDSNPVDI